MPASHRLGIWMLTLLAAGAVGSARPARADQLVAGGITYSDIGPAVEVDGQAGLIRFRYVGRAMTAPLARFDAIRLARYPKLALAYDARDAGYHQRAADLLAEVRRQAPEQWLRNLLLIHLLAEQQQAGRFADAVDSYLDWLALGWTTPKIELAGPLPEKDSEQLTRAIAALERAIERADAQPARLRLKAVLLRCYQRQGSDKLDALADELAGRSPGTSAPSADPGVTADLSVSDTALLARVAQAVERQDWAAGLAQARIAGRELSRPALADLFVLIGRCYEGQGDWPHAGLAYMRVVIHYPEHRQAAEAAWSAARVHERLGRPDVVERLHQTLVQRYGGSPQARMARAALARGD